MSRGCPGDNMKGLGSGPVAATVEITPLPSPAADFADVTGGPHQRGGHRADPESSGLGQGTLPLSWHWLPQQPLQEVERGAVTREKLTIN